MATNGISKLDLKRQNRMQILKLLRNEGPTSRIDIARQIGITKAAVTIITNEMIGQNIIYEKGEQAPTGNKVSRGRKKIMLDVNPTYKMGMGLVIDSGKIYFGLCTLKGDAIEKQTREISAEDRTEDIFATIQKMYQDIMYKNDLKPALVAGLGVCISEEYYSMMHIGINTDGTLDYSVLETDLAQFVGAPTVFGTLMEGVAMAEIDYSQDFGENADHIIVLRYAKDFQSAFSIGQELYKGSRGKVLDLAHYKIADEPECVCGKKGCVEAALSQKRIAEKIRAIFTPEQTPILWEQSGGVFQIAMNLLHQPEYIPQDPRVWEQFHEMGQLYSVLFSQMIQFLDPDKIVLFGEGEWFEFLTNYLVQTEGEKYAATAKKMISTSRIKLSNVFLGAAALATRKFFINKGGF